MVRDEAAGLFADDLRVVAANFDVVDEDVRVAPVQGQVNLTVFLGEELVLRLPRTPAAAERLAREAQVMPLARAAGVPTPELISYDPTLESTSRPYVVLQRVRGRTLTQLTPGSAVHQRALASLGEVLARLHRVRQSDVGPVEMVPTPFAFSASELLDELVVAGEIGSAQQHWLLEQFSVLRPGGPFQADPVLLHRDVIASNVVVDAQGEVQALLDWGCAEWGAAARDLVGLPLGELPVLLSGYRPAAEQLSGARGAGDDLSLERDALWNHLYLALARLLKRPSTSQERNWAAPRSATLLDVLAFSTGATQEPWPVHLRRLSSRSVLR